MDVWAYVFTTTRQPKKVLRSVRRIEGVIHADALFGSPDVVAIVVGADMRRRQLLADIGRLAATGAFVPIIGQVRENHTVLIEAGWA